METSADPFQPSRYVNLNPSPTLANDRDPYIYDLNSIFLIRGNVQFTEIKQILNKIRRIYTFLILVLKSWGHENMWLPSMVAMWSVSTSYNLDRKFPTFIIFMKYRKVPQVSKILLSFSFGFFVKYCMHNSVYLNSLGFTFNKNSTKLISKKFPSNFLKKEMSFSLVFARNWSFR